MDVDGITRVESGTEWTPENNYKQGSIRLKIRYCKKCVGSSPSPGTNFLGTNWPLFSFRGLLYLGQSPV